MRHHQWNTQPPLRTGVNVAASHVQISHKVASEPVTSGAIGERGATISGDAGNPRLLRQTLLPSAYTPLTALLPGTSLVVWLVNDAPPLAEILKPFVPAYTLLPSAYALYVESLAKNPLLALVRLSNEAPPSVRDH